MLKSLVVAGTTALVIGATGLAIAQPGAKGPGPGITAEDTAALTDARIAGLKAGLKLTTEQEKHWPAAETAIREMAAERAEKRAQRREMRREARQKWRETMKERRQARQEGSATEDAAEAAKTKGEGLRGKRVDMVERMRGGAKAMTERAEAMTKFADAIEPLYDSLQPDQKRRFAMLMRAGRSFDGRPGHHHRGGHFGRQ